MIKILANDGINADGKTLLEEAGYQVDTDKVPQDNLINVLPDYDVIIVRSATQVRKDLIDACPKLKVIARGGVGLDNIDSEYAESKGITVFNTPAASSQAVAELVFAHIFAMARFLHQSNKELKTGKDFNKLKKAYSDGVQLRGKRLGIIGFGRIGQEVARIGVGLGLEILATDILIQEADIDFKVYKSNDVRLSIHFESTDINTVIRQSDILTLHVPYSGGRPIIGKEEIDMMKTGSYLINTARGGAVDESALLEALESGKIAGAGLDVFENEPTPKKELLEHPKVSVTPHIGASTIEAQSNIGLELADRILAYFGDDK